MPKTFRLRTNLRMVKNHKRIQYVSSAGDYLTNSELKDLGLEYDKIVLDSNGFEKSKNRPHFSKEYVESDLLKKISGSVIGHDEAENEMAKKIVWSKLTWGPQF